MPSHRFSKKIRGTLSKERVTVLQLNLGSRCNQTCKHCHIEAGPSRVEEINKDNRDDIIELIRRFDDIKVVDITGGAPEYHFGFRDIVKVALAYGKEVIVRSNLTIFFEQGFEDLPYFFKEHSVRVVASMPCYLKENVDAMRGRGVYDKSIMAISMLNKQGYGNDLTLDLVYNPSMQSNAFTLAPRQQSLEKDYKQKLKEDFGLYFNSLYVFNNIPLGRYYNHLKANNLYEDYISFLEDNFNSATLPFLMCRNQLSIDYEGRVYDCDFNLISKAHCRGEDGTPLSLKDLLKYGTLSIVKDVEVRDYCFGCTAGSGSSCSGALLSN